MGEKLASKMQLIYDAIIYGLGVTLSEYERFSREAQIEKIGKNIRRYLREKGVKIQRGKKPIETLANILDAFLSIDFVEDIKIEEKDGIIHIVWKGLLGIEAYKRLYDEIRDPFLSCPINAVIHDALAKDGFALRLRDKRFDLDRNVVESWEEIVPRRVFLSKPSILGLEDLTDAIVTGIPSGIILHDRDMRIVYVNESFKTITSLGDNVIGKSSFEILPEPLIEKMNLREKISRVRDEGLIIGPEEMLYETPDGERLTLAYRLYPIRDLGGNIQYILAIIDNITERKRREEKLRSLKEFHESIVNAISDAVIVIDPYNYKIISVNKAALKRLKLREEEVIGRTCYEVTHHREKPCEPHHCICPVQEMLNTSKSTIVEHIHFDRDGNEVYVEVSAGPVRDKEGKIVQVVHVARDITERKLIEEMLRSSEEKFRVISTFARDAIILIDDEGRISYWNPAAERIFGYTKEEAMGKDLHKLLVPKRFLEAFSRGFERFKETGEGFAIGKTLELAAIRKDGTEFPIELSLSALQMKRKWYAIGIVRDVTERKRVEEAKSHFISMATHELRTPLVSIKGYMDLILAGELGPISEKVRSSLEVVKRNTDRLLYLTEDLLDIQRLEVGKFHIELEPLNLQEIIKQSIKEIQPFIDKKRQSLHLETPKEALPILGDHIRLSQVVMNLLSNASKFTPESGEIILRVEEEEATIKVQVSDTGIGIQSQDLERVFQPFACIKKPTYFKGACLGLSVTKDIVEAHGGRIWAESEGLGKGATFTFTLPKQLREEEVVG